MRLKNKALILGSLLLVAALFLAGPPTTAQSSQLAGGPVGPTDIEVMPSVPIPGDNISIRVSGTWSDSCVPLGEPLVSIDGNQITIDLVFPLYFVCMTVLTDWEETAIVGHLPAGDYAVVVRTTETEEPEVIARGDFTVGVCGDQNGDGVTDIRDVVIDLQIMTGMIEPTLSQQRLSDLKRDGRVNVFDAIRGLQIITGLAEMPGQCGPAQVPPGLVAWWPGHGHADDVEGDNHGTLTGGAGFAPGMVGEAFRLDGNGDAVDFADSLDEIFTGPGKRFTIELWARLESLPGAAGAALVAKHGDSLIGPENQRQLILIVRPDRSLDFGYWGSLGPPVSLRVIRSDTPLNVGKYHHIAIAYDGSVNTNDGLDRVEVYVDGLAQGTHITASQGPLGDIQDGAAHLALGAAIASNSDSGRFLSGQIDEVSIYSRALTAEEIRDIYEAGSAGKMKP